VEALRSEVAALEPHGDLVVAGPFLLDGIDVELLLWRPFLRWVVGQHPALAARLVVVSRGGVSDWYSGVGSAYVDVSKLFSYPVEQVARDSVALELLKTPKRLQADDFDRAVRDAVAATFDCEAASLLSPASFYRACYLTRKMQILDRLDGVLEHRPLPAGSAAASPVELPGGSYTVAAFPFSRAFPDTQENRAVIADLVLAASAERTVVLIGGDQLDVGTAGHIVVAPPLGLEMSLAESQALLAGANAFLGSVCGLAHLACSIGVPATAVFSDDDVMRRAWLTRVQKQRDEPGWGRFELLRAHSEATASPSPASVVEGL
jgi:hypothetical protein